MENLFTILLFRENKRRLVLEQYGCTFLYVRSLPGSFFWQEKPTMLIEKVQCEIFFFTDDRVKYYETLFFLVYSSFVFLGFLLEMMNT